ncbi:MAG: hypothetical protein C9356_03770 [Oleiphilus sp.]|nr:MAG: hypothetical protein C9356_03770 [Oleiphilus sp.]
MGGRGKCLPLLRLLILAFKHLRFLRVSLILTPLSDIYADSLKAKIMTDTANTLEPFIKRRERNLMYFREHFQDIYALFKDYQMKDAQLNILTETDEVNLLQDGRHVYPEGAKNYAEKEVESFREVYQEGKTIYSFVPPFGGDYEFPRFGQIAVNELLNKSPVNKSNFRYYRLQNFYPLIVFLGCGLGYHIEKMVREHKVQNMIILEPNLDRFAASLYSVDWAEICQDYKSKNGRMLHFILGAEESDYLLWAVTWNRLVELSPHFPVMTLFYNHQGRDLFDKVSEKVNKDLLVFLMSWGHYDDEIRQLNNALHNYHMGVKELPLAMPEPSQTPVFIVGAGPSLDDRVDYIREVRDRVIMISCGTALKTLAAYGVKPDIHVELESDLLAYIAVSRAADESYYRDIKLVGPSHISPLIFKLFGDGRMYYKNESATALLFGQQSGHIIKNGTPTCTNLGVALAVSMGFKNLFLFGLDFGFRDIEHHHAKGSIYYEKLLKLEHEENELIEVETVDGSKAWSTPNYFTSKRKVENMLQQNEADELLKVYNCSDVANIEGAQWLKEDTFIELVESLDSSKDADMGYMFDPKAVSCDLSKADEKLKYIEANLKALNSDVSKLFDADLETLEDLSILCSRINWYLEDILKPRTPDFYFLVRGTIRHFLCAGFAHAFALEDPQACANYIQEWKKSFRDFYQRLPAHFSSVVFKEFDVDQDPWVKQSIFEREDGINPFFNTPIEDLQLQI